MEGLPSSVPHSTNNVYRFPPRYAALMQHTLTHPHTTAGTQGAFRVTVPASVERIASIELWPSPGGPGQLRAKTTTSWQHGLF